MDTILVANAGSSSVKFQVFEIEQGQRLKRQIKGMVDGIGTKPKLHAARCRWRRSWLTGLTPRTPCRTCRPLLQTAAAWLRDELRIDPIAVGHRVVHGGPDYDRPVVVDRERAAAAWSGSSRWPRCISRIIWRPSGPCLRDRPDLPQVACFDTAFHRGHGPLADHFAIPLKLYDEGVRRYGFHGLSYEYIAGRLREVAPGIAHGKVIAAHLGNGASMCAMAAGKSVESTMGFTALDGLPMGTRCGQIDPGVVLYLIEQKGMSAHEVQHLLYHDCGLKGLSGISNDMRELEASPDPRAAFAIDYFVYRIALFTGTLAAALGGFDAFVFTAGIGENSASLRARVAAKLSWLGVKLDEAANIGGRQLISAPDSAVALYIVPTDEELMIAQHTLALLSKQHGRAI